MGIDLTFKYWVMIIIEYLTVNLNIQFYLLEEFTVWKQNKLFGIAKNAVYTK